jgi:hypothetical protein
MDRSDEGFLQRWARRKAEAREHPPAESGDDAGQPPSDLGQSSTETGGEPAGAHEAVTAGSEKSSTNDDPVRSLSEDDFADVDFEALDFDSDYGRFMGKGVPDSIRNRALRKLWVSDPVLANIDGLDDYCEDFSDAVWATSEIKTAWQVGRGFMTDEEVADWDRLGKPAEDGKAPPVAAAEAAEAAGEAETVAATEVPAPSNPGDQPQLTEAPAQSTPNTSGETTAQPEKTS